MGSWKDDDEKIEYDALLFRRRIGIGDDQIFIDAPTLVYKVRHFFPGVQYSLVEDAELPPPGGQWRADKRLFIFRKTIFEAANKLNANPHARWTLAHEVSHFANGDPGIRNRSAKGSLEKVILPKIRRIESRTDRFTAALLAPLHLIEFNEPISSIACRFGLSDEAAEIRAEEVARAYRRRHGIARPLPKSVENVLADLKKRK